MVGMIFSIEFILLFLALDLTTVTRTGVIFYSMPVWLTLAAHFLLPAERMTPRRALGLALAFAGVAWAIADRGAGGGAGSIWGDLMSLAAAFCWAGAILFARATPLKTLPAETQILWQVAVSTPVLLAVSPLFGPLVRDLAPVHLWGLAFQILGVASFGFILWFWLLKIYPASAVASFAFLSPVFSVLLGWLLLGEEVGLSILGSLALVSAGIVLVNRPARRSQVPQ
jgi:drug/metabolite transporter (DMT)-like permease